jgi:hypothetical protein
MTSRIYIDLSSEDQYEGSYERLIRNLYGKPALRRPALGTPPSYIGSEEQITLKTSHKVAALKDALINDRRSASGMISDFLDSFISSLESYRLSGGSALDFDDRVIESVEKMLPLRNEFINFTFTLFKYRDSVDVEQLRDFFEKLASFSYPPEQVQSWTEVDCDNFRFFNYELMLSFKAVLFRLKKFKEAAFLLNSQYFYRSTPGADLKLRGLQIFNMHARSINDTRNHRLSMGRFSLTADLIKIRAASTEIDFSGYKRS